MAAGDFTPTTASEMGELESGELHVRVDNARQELFNLRFQAATGQLTNTSRLGVLRREVARLLTEARRREIALAGAYFAAQEGESE